MRKLTLNKETVAELTTDELGDVVGATFPTKYECTESYQVCNPNTRKVCLPTWDACFTTHGCG